MACIILKMVTVPNFFVMILSVNFLDVPKSITLRLESAESETNIIFSGFKSRCTICYSWQYTTAKRICFMKSAALLSEK